MPKPSTFSYRRIDRLRQLAYDCNLTDDEARKFGKLTKTSTWEALLNSHGLEFEPKPEISLSNVTPANNIQSSSCNLLEWVDFTQAIALALSSVGFVVLLLGMFPRINPLNLLPVKITIQIGQK